ncbi:biopolymer transporter ExbD [Paraglaciecola sp. L3A3]|uniref:ExbD/TolR family protein n=1 Tax=Paraglaciecola sp. L3A3 TaxID=2686358 RepID=UPI00131AF7AC|nr:biopolymer transporter ExbD [Paraglaciecola sp. L3A3]
MKMSVRARRLQRNYKRNSKQTKLSLVSLMDIFTILVFFLMLNASDVQVLQNDKSVTLPESTANTAAKETLLLLVNQDQVILQGKKMADIPDILASQNEVIASLVEELNYQSTRQASTLTTDENQPAPEGSAKAITIMADQAMPYALLKKLMQSCAQAGYTDIALAVEQKTPTNQGEGV